jgi:hypothetical protein
VVNGRALTLLTAAAFGLAIALPILSWLVLYGGPGTWPGLIGNYTATLFALVIALWWERHNADRLVQGAASLAQEERRAELLRRLTGVRDELGKIEASVDSVLEKVEKAKFFFPDMPVAAWTASSDRLAALLADYRLGVDVGTVYAQVEDLRWRLRFLAELSKEGHAALDEFRPLIVALAEEMKKNLEALRPKIKAELSNPNVQPIGLMYSESGTVVVRASLTATSRITGSPPKAAPGIHATSDVRLRGNNE